MNRRILIATFVLLAISCNLVQQAQPTTVPAQPPVSVLPPAASEQPAVPALTATSAPKQPTGTNCASEDVNKLGQSIAEDYPFVTTEEVMTWFCNGADFEDIMVALATEDETGTPTEEMLVMRAEGLTWEEIWQVVGFSE